MKENLEMKYTVNKMAILLSMSYTPYQSAGGAEGSIDAKSPKTSACSWCVRVIGATTLDRISKIYRKDAALERRLPQFRVNEPSAKTILLKS